MSPRTKKRALFLKTASGYGTDPSSNGSAYRWLPTRELGLLQDQKAPIRTDYFTGRNFMTRPIAGPDGWSFDCKIPLWGLAAAAADGAAPGADDVLDEILSHILGTQVLVNGRTVAGAAGSELTLASSVGSLQDLVPVFQTGVPAGAPRTQWVKLTDVSTAPVYVTKPDWTEAPTGGVAYGRKIYRPSDAGGADLAFVYRNAGDDYTLLGGRCTRAVIEWSAGKIIELALTFSGDTKTKETKASLPVPGVAPPATPIRSLGSPLWFNDVAYAIQKGSIDLGITAQVLEGGDATNGRAGYESISILPKVTVNPLRDDAWSALRRAGSDPSRLLIQLGAGTLSGGVLDTMAFEAVSAGVMEAPDEDENGRLRTGVQFELFDPGIFSGATLAHVFQMARA